MILFPCIEECKQCPVIVLTVHMYMYIYMYSIIEFSYCTLKHVCISMRMVRASRRSMFQVEINQSVHFTVITVLVIAVGVQECCCAGSLVTTPPAIGGVLTSCGEAQLTCSHDNVAHQATRWAITRTDSSLVCIETIDHNLPAPYSCDEFRFKDVTGLPGSVSVLNSTAMVNPLRLDLSGSQMECREGPAASSPLAGSVTFCVVGEYTWIDLHVCQPTDYTSYIQRKYFSDNSPCPITWRA